MLFQNVSPLACLLLLISVLFQSNRLTVVYLQHLYASLPGDNWLSSGKTNPELNPTDDRSQACVYMYLILGVGGNLTKELVRPRQPLYRLSLPSLQ